MYKVIVEREYLSEEDGQPSYEKETYNVAPYFGPWFGGSYKKYVSPEEGAKIVELLTKKYPVIDGYDEDYCVYRVVRDEKGPEDSLPPKLLELDEEDWC